MVTDQTGTVAPKSCELPSGWAATTLGEACLVIQGQSPPGKTYNTDGQGLPFLQGKAEFGPMYPEAVKWCSAPSKIAEAGDVLISVRAPVGPTNLCGVQSCIGRGLAAIRPYGGMSERFILYALRATEEELRSKATGTTFEAIRGDDLRAHPIGLPPLPEQRRIVAEIEKQFTRLDASVEGLKRAQVNLKRYRASVLKAACEGKLVPTEAELARAEGRDYEPADRLLERILAERRAHWESQKNRRGKYKEPVPPDVAELPNLTEGWVWAGLNGLTQNFDAQRVPVKAEDRGKMQGRYPYYGASGVIDGVNEYLFDGTFLLIAEDGANLLSRSTPIAFIAHGQFWVNNHAHVLKPIGQLSPSYLETYINGLNIQHYVTGTAQPKLTQTALNRIPVPLPPIAEQERIISEVSRHLSIIQKAEAAVDAGLKRAERLRQSILKQAFSGKLVPQDPNDEPASALLERIRAEREAAEAATKAQRKPRRRRRKSAPARQLSLPKVNR